jgi:hypothetical protein
MVAAIHGRNAGDVIAHADRVIQVADGEVVNDRVRPAGRPLR